jgi:signal transduction histidine kinase/ligand-binding sensor domain-containing protein
LAGVPCGNVRSTPSPPSWVFGTIRRAFLAVLFGSAFVVPANALDPQRAPSQYVVSRWGARDLPSSSIHALLQTRDRYLWLGTTAGLVRFDGARFVFFGNGNSPALHEGGVHSLTEAPDGTLYIGTSAGAVVQYRQQVFTKLGVPDAAGAVHALRARDDGSLWVAAHGRPLYRWREGAAANIGAVNINAPLALAEAAGRMWVGTGLDGLIGLENEKSKRDTMAIGDVVQAVQAARDGSLWLGTPHGLVHVQDGRLTRYTTQDGLSHDFVSAIVEDRDGNLWVGTAGGGLSRLTAGRFTPFTSRDGLSDDHIRALLEDHEGNLWVGTADGLDCLSDSRFVTYGQLEGLKDPAVTAIAGTRDGSVWIGMNSAGLARLRGGALEHFRLPAGVGSDAIVFMAEARSGGLWVLADNGRVFYIEDGQVSERTPEYPDSTRKARVVVEDEDGPIFLIPGVGPRRARGRRLEPLYDPQPALGYFHTAYKDPRGALWIGTSTGLVHAEKGGYTVLGQKDGLPHDRVRSMTAEPNGALWVATIGGLGYLKDGVCRKVTAADGLPESYLRLVLDDGRGALWLASLGYIFRLEKKDVFDFFAGKVARVSPVTFDTWDGLRATEGGALSNSPGFRAPDGRLWFATARGAAVVDPARVSVEDAAPRVVIEGVAVDGRREAASEYPPGRGEVTIDYTALAFRSPRKLLFRYRLEGFDEAWVDASPRRSAYYSNLPAGHYRFVVMASNRDGRWNGTPTTLEFAIRPPFYQRSVFHLACAALVVGLAALAYRLRVRAMHARLTAIILERTRIARELHDTLAQGLAGVGIQLHTAMSILPDNPPLERVRRQLEQAHSMIRSSLTEVRRSIWVLRAQTARDAKDLATSLAESLSHLTTDTGAQSTFEVKGEPRPLSPDLERNLLRIAHEAVTNAVRHAAADHIAIVLEFGPEHVRLRVHDDGRGFDAEAAMRRSRGEHFGLVGITERTRSLGGEISFTSRPGDGAEIDCRIPYHHAEVPAAGGEEASV